MAVDKMHWKGLPINALSCCHFMMSITSAQIVRIVGKGDATGKVDILVWET